MIVLLLLMHSSTHTHTHTHTHSCYASSWCTTLSSPAVLAEAQRMSLQVSSCVHTNLKNKPFYECSVQNVRGTCSPSYSPLCVVIFGSISCSRFCPPQIPPFLNIYSTSPRPLLTRSQSSWIHRTPERKRLWVSPNH